MGAARTNEATKQNYWWPFPFWEGCHQECGIYSHLLNGEEGDGIYIDREGETRPWRTHSGTEDTDRRTLCASSVSANCGASTGRWNGSSSSLARPARSFRGPAPKEPAITVSLLAAR